ncbi:MULTISPECIES: enoyl-CoA hydratase-related protein [unclassified Rhodococcus (in: high G+C Gram-positive bacteria)]|uniref:enoyl-CoA hydratase-related protein n=1 Tax=unclassified Rhodococcus (in: high G+C Gram-positive bacteria) TaxID=192944 RepID=UPI0006F28B26|nr:MULTISPECIES: enoyl-CoA hydratase-related protein [unclassified Rhodococcus (in: high G+C Gram-positive bacteria)]KQU28450.1 crotonase [Rhodococcus sp. Leaf225]KQU47671.1 crotonase [Rhodococcus sp. Leaf258]
MSNELLYSVEGHVAYLTLNRPRKLNAIDAALDEQLAARWDEVDGDPDIWVAVLRGAGDRAFCAGGDISGSTDTLPARIALGGGLTGIGGPLRHLRPPLVAAVHGHVLGGGFELAMCADIIVAADDSQFGLPEVRAGIIGEAGVVHRAVRQLPHRVAMAMILTGETLSAHDALHFGLVNEVVPRAQLAQAEKRWVDRLTASSPLAQQAAKQAVLARANHPLETALSTKFEAIEAYAASDDVLEGRLARAEKRVPRWTGR